MKDYYVVGAIYRNLWHSKQIVMILSLPHPGSKYYWILNEDGNTLYLDLRRFYRRVTT